MTLRTTPAEAAAGSPATPGSAATGGTGGAGASPLLRVSGLAVAYGPTTVLDDVSFDVAPGELLAFLGANGSGKSTTLRAVAGLTPHQGGEIEIGGEHGRPAIVFQKIHLVARRSVLDNVCAGALARMPVAASLHPWFYPAEIRREAMVALDRVGLADKAPLRAGTLSGGQQQRVAIARALCQGAEVLLADEPVAALDPEAARTVMGLLRDLAHDEGLAVAAVLHQPDLAREFADTIIGLRSGGIVLRGRADEVPAEEITGLYTPVTNSESK
ncbi:phosphonate ABC transporter ATP-binding protein [Brevibacterium casei]|uniref:phosphonate ABC transporter ATP-binding protein n=1 Tax=Brevibacterium casei TaxID=33889 RepID=UPI003EBEE858